MFIVSVSLLTSRALALSLSRPALCALFLFVLCFVLFGLQYAPNLSHRTQDVIDQVEAGLYLVKRVGLYLKKICASQRQFSSEIIKASNHEADKKSRLNHDQYVVCLFLCVLWVRVATSLAAVAAAAAAAACLAALAGGTVAWQGIHFFLLLFFLVLLLLLLY
jgi:hypothetical protein